jgi:RNA polymerase sigma-70 factor (ECF subfamily)
MKRLCDTELTEDLVQDTLLAAMKSFESFAGGSSERTWLTGILKHKIAEHHRKGRRSRPWSEEQLAAWTEQQFKSSGKWKLAPKRWQKIDPIEQDELRSALGDCLDSLPPTAAEALIMSACHQNDAKSICNALKISATNLGVLRFRARLAMRRCLELKWFGRQQKAHP